MASLIFNTGVDSHPTIRIDSIDLARGQVGFKFVGSEYNGDCMEQFEISLEDHGDMTILEMVESISRFMVAKLDA